MGYVCLLILSRNYYRNAVKQFIAKVGQGCFILEGLQYQCLTTEPSPNPSRDGN
jgi:hypothetical protein